MSDSTSPIAVAPDVASNVAAAAPSRRDGFAGYAMLASLTLLVLSLLVADRMSPGPLPPAVPPSDRLVRIRIGGTPAAPPRRETARLDPRRAPSAPPSTQVPPPPSPQAPTRTHVVADGETLGDIARSHLGTWTRWEEIAKLNGLAKDAPIRKGRTLRLPAR